MPLFMLHLPMCIYLSEDDVRMVPDPATKDSRIRRLDLARLWNHLKGCSQTPRGHQQTMHSRRQPFG